MRVLLFLALLAGCGGDLGEALVVVQETNVPNPPPPCQEFAHRYTVDYTRTCDDVAMQVDVCADEELCEAQLEAILEPLTSCDEVHGYEAAIPDAC